MKQVWHAVLICLINYQMIFIFISIIKMSLIYMLWIQVFLINIKKIVLIGSLIKSI